MLSRNPTFRPRSGGTLLSSPISSSSWTVSRLALALVLVGVWGCGGSTSSDPGSNETQVPQTCLTGTEACADRIEIASGLFLRLFRTHSLEGGHPLATQGVIVVHGADRNPDDYFERMIAAARAAGVLSDLVVVAPYFQTLEDGPAPDEPYWSEGGWKRGHLSRTGGPVPRVSSYAAMDRIVEALADPSRFPALTRIVISGHSAGGQVVHRYAAGSQVEDQIVGIVFRYVVANPSTYLYLGPERADGEGWSLPDLEACPSYDDWHYGMNELNTYMRSIPESQARSQLERRDVRIVIGDADTGSAALDQSCGADLQGAHRFERGRTLVRYMDAFFPGHHHVEMVVPGVGHSSTQMFASAVGREALFVW